MNETAFRIMGLHTKIERNTKLSKQLKVLAGTCLFFSFCYCHGTKNIEMIDKSQALLTNIVWIISFIILAGLFMKDSYCAKNNKVTELAIYNLEVEELNNKKVVAEIKGEMLPDYIINKQIDIPDEKVSLPIIYYSILLGLDIVIRISMIGII